MRAFGVPLLTGALLASVDAPLSTAARALAPPLAWCVPHVGGVLAHVVWSRALCKLSRSL